MTPAQTYSVQGGNPFNAKDSKPRLIPEIKLKVRAAKDSGKIIDAYLYWKKKYILFNGKTHPSKLAKEKTIEIKSNNIHEAILNTHRFAVGMVSHLSRRLSLRRYNKILSRSNTRDRSVNCNEVEILIRRDEYEIVHTPIFFCSFPDLSTVILVDKIL